MQADAIYITKYLVTLGRLTCILSKELFTYQLISKWYNSECANWKGFLNYPTHTLYQRKKWVPERWLDLPQVTHLQRCNFYLAWFLSQYICPLELGTNSLRQKPTWGQNNISEFYLHKHAYTPGLVTSHRTSTYTSSFFFIPKVNILFLSCASFRWFIQVPATNTDGHSQTYSLISEASPGQQRGFSLSGIQGRCRGK